LDRFFRDFRLDYAVNPVAERTSLIPLHGAHLVQCFTAAVPLLPKQHLELLRYLLAAKFMANVIDVQNQLHIEHECGQNRMHKRREFTHHFFLE
jgi:hypothetical protein